MWCPLEYRSDDGARKLFGELRSGEEEEGGARFECGWNEEDTGGRSGKDWKVQDSFEGEGEFQGGEGEAQPGREATGGG